MTPHASSSSVWSSIGLTSAQRPRSCMQGDVEPPSGNRSFLDCGAKRSATPLSNQHRRPKSGVVATLCHRSPKRFRRGLTFATAAFALLVSPAPSIAEANPVNNLGITSVQATQQFEAANKLYEEKRFPEAVTAYEAILAGGRASPAIYFNLGNARFKANRIGEAIAAYRRAEAHTPRDPDVRANLQFARKQVQGPTLKPGRWQKWFGTLSFDEWTGLGVVGVWLTFGLLALAQLRPALRLALRLPSWAAAGATLLLLACLATAWVLNTPGDLAVVISKEVAVRNGPLEESQSAFTVHDGAELRITDRKDDWLQVTDGTRRLGWLQRRDVAAW